MTAKRKPKTTKVFEEEKERVVRVANAMQDAAGPIMNAAEKFVDDRDPAFTNVTKEDILKSTAPEFKAKVDLTCSEEGKYITIDNREQLLRAVLNKSFPHGRFVFIDTALLAKECQEIGLAPGKHVKRGVTIK